MKKVNNLSLCIAMSLMMVPMVAHAAGDDTTYVKVNSNAAPASVDSAADGAIAIGPNAKSNSMHNIAIGLSSNSEANAVNSIAIGSNAHNISGDTEQIAIGSGATSSRQGSIAIGSAANAGYQSNAIGFRTRAANQGTALSNNAAATGTQSLALVSEAQATGTRSIAIGKAANVSAEDAIGLGLTTKVTGEQSVAIGANSAMTGTASASLGYKNTVAQNNTFVVGNNVTTTQANSVVLGSSSTDRAATSESSATVDGLSFSDFAGVGAANKGVVSVGSSGGERQLINLASGRVAADSTDAINGSQLYSVAKGLKTYATYTPGDNVSVVDNADGTHTISSLNTITTLTPGDSTILINDDGTNGNHDYKVKLNSDITNQINNNTNAIHKMGRDISRVGAMGAALSGLHPLDFDPHRKLNLAVSGGFYKDQNAFALGAFYRPNEDVMFSLGSTLGNNENMYNLAGSFKIGRKGLSRTKKEAYERAPISTVYVLQEQVKKDHERIDQLEAMVKQLLAEKHN